MLVSTAVDGTAVQAGPRGQEDPKRLWGTGLQGNCHVLREKLRASGLTGHEKVEGEPLDETRLQGAACCTVHLGVGGGGQWGGQALVPPCSREDLWQQDWAQVPGTAFYK